MFVFLHCIFCTNSIFVRTDEVEEPVTLGSRRPIAPPMYKLSRHKPEHPEALEQPGSRFHHQEKLLPIRTCSY